MVNVIGNGHGDTSSNPGRGLLHFTYLGKGMNPIILPPAMSKYLGRLVFWPCFSNQSRRRKSLNSDLLDSAKKLTLCHILLVRRGW